MAHAQLNQPKDPQLAEFIKLYHMPENQQLIGLLNEMISHEVFLYGGESMVGFVELATQVNGLGCYLNLIGATDPNRAQLRGILDVLADNLDLIKIPDLVIGFKLGKIETAQAQLKRLEGILTGLEQQVPILKGRVKREKIAGGDFFDADAGRLPGALAASSLQGLRGTRRAVR